MVYIKFCLYFVSFTQIYTAYFPILKQFMFLANRGDCSFTILMLCLKFRLITPTKYTFTRAIRWRGMLLFRIQFHRNVMESIREGAQRKLTPSNKTYARESYWKCGSGRWKVKTETALMNDGYMPTTAHVQVWRTQHGEQLLRLYVQSWGQTGVYWYSTSTECFSQTCFRPRLFGEEGNRVDGPR